MNIIKKILILPAFVLGSLYSQAQSHTLDSLLSESSNNNKKILLYFSGSDWCAPCIKFKENFINKPEFKDFAKDNLMILNADFPRKSANQLSEEKTKENEALADKYNPNGHFPYVLLLNAKGEVIKKWEALPKETVSEFINEIKN
jgi:thioredoxin-related protein